MRALIFLLLTFNFFIGYTQADLLNTTSSYDLTETSVSPENEESNALEYAKVNDADIIFSFTVWEVIDLSQRVNFPYLYPINEGNVTPDRKPLIWHLKKAITEGGVPAYRNERFSEEQLMQDEEIEDLFTYKYMKEGDGNFDDPEGKDKLVNGWRPVLEELGYNFPEEEWVKYDPTDTEAYYDIPDSLSTYYNKKWEKAASTVLPETDFNIETVDNDDVTRYVIKGIYYFDRINTELKYRPIAMGPIAPSAEEKGDSNTNSSSGGDSNGGLESLFLEDGKELQATNFSVGSSVKVMDGDGGCTDDYGESIPCDDEELILLAVGQYTLDDGRILVVEEEGVIAESADFQPESELSDNSETSDAADGSESSYQDGRELVLESNKQYEPLFWIFYPDAREELSTAYCFTQKNMSKPISFDRLINSRRFSATIYKEANVYENRDIRDYIPNNSLMQLLESERIKEKIRNKEQDMWSY